MPSKIVPEQSRLNSASRTRPASSSNDSTLKDPVILQFLTQFNFIRVCENVKPSCHTLFMHAFSKV